MGDIQKYNHLNNSFYTMPGSASQVMSAREVRETIAITGGWIMAAGEHYDIVARELAGAYMIELEMK